MLFQLLKRFIEGQQIEWVSGRDIDHIGDVIQIMPCAQTDCLSRQLTSRLFNQDSSHRFGGRGKEMPTRIPVLRFNDVDK